MKKTKTMGKSTVAYDVATGVFTWVCAYRKPKRTGMIAPREMTNGYLYIFMNGKNISASRLAWELTRGEIPAGLEIDHINRDKKDNRPENLRLVTRAQNLFNRKFKENTCKATGVSIHSQSGLYRARYRGQTVYCTSIGAAAMAYEQMRQLNAA